MLQQSSTPAGRLIQWALLALFSVAFAFMLLESQSATKQQADSLLMELTQCCSRSNTAAVQSPPPPVKAVACTPTPTTTGSPTTAPSSTTNAFDLALRTKLLNRLESFKQEHLANNRAHAIGLRGVSWIHKHLNGTLIGATQQEVASALLNADENGTITIRFRDVSEEQQCPPAMANMVSIYVRLAGPELVAVTAQPVMGKCEWEAKLQISIPGQYTVLARLMHYNGIRDLFVDYAEVHANTLGTSVSLRMLHHIPRYPYFSGKKDCAKMCSRYELCDYSIGFKNPEQPCYMLSKSTNDTAGSVFFAKDIYTHLKQDVKETHGTFYRKTTPYDKMTTVWQLGCGRDEMLLKWAPCSGLNATQIGRRIKGVEDMILFEFEHSQLSVPLLGSAVKTDMERAQREFDRPTLPTCTHEQLVQNLPSGRWTRSPARRTQSCGVLPPFDISNPQTSPLQLHLTDPLCNLRYELDTLNIRSRGLDYRWSPSSSFFEVWKTELSDSYHRAAKPEDNHALVWEGYFRLPPQATCSMPPMYTPAAIRQCVINRQLKFHFWGDSIAEFFRHYFYAQVKLAFPELKIGYPMAFALPNREAYTPKGTSSPPRRFFITNFRLPNNMLSSTVAQQRGEFEKEAKGMQPANVTDMVFLTPPFSPWERRDGLTAERTEHYADVMRDVLLPRGWKQIDLTRLSREWTYDATPERDSLHVAGHTMVTAAQLLFHMACGEE